MSMPLGYGHRPRSDRFPMAIFPEETASLYIINHSQAPKQLPFEACSGVGNVYKKEIREAAVPLLC